MSGKFRMYGNSIYHHMPQISFVSLYVSHKTTQLIVIFPMYKMFTLMHRNSTNAFLGQWTKRTALRKFQTYYHNTIHRWIPTHASPTQPSKTDFFHSDSKEGSVILTCFQNLKKYISLPWKFEIFTDPNNFLYFLECKAFVKKTTFRSKTY